MPVAGSRSWLRWGERAAALLVLGFLAAHLVGGWSAVAAHAWTVDWPRLLVSLVTLGLTYSGFVVLWRWLLARLGGDLSLVDAHRVWYLANLARYVPGKLLQLAGTAYLVRTKGVSPVLGVAATVTSQAFFVGAGFVVVAVALPETAERAGHLAPAGAVAAIGLLAILLGPAFNPLYRLALRLVGRLEYAVELRWTDRLALTAAYGVAWITLGIAFHLFLAAWTELPRVPFGPAVGIFAAGYLAGWLAVFVPGGLGVREGVYAALLGLYIPTAVAVAVAVLARLWSTAVELVAVGWLVARHGIDDLRATSTATPGDGHG